MWPKYKVDGLRELFPKYSNRILAATFDVSLPAVMQKAKDLGLKKSPERLAEAKAESCFQKGHKSWNTGTVGLVKVTAAMKKTMFKPGNKPYNTGQDGDISDRPDKRGVMRRFIRIREGRWEYLSRHNYRKSVGPIPKGGVIRFRDGDTLNCEPENLECISQTLNMLLNSKHKYSREIAEVKEVICYINNEIKEPTSEKQNE